MSFIFNGISLFPIMNFQSIKRIDNLDRINDNNFDNSFMTIYFRKFSL